MRKIKVMYLLYNYPQLSETYIKNEIEALLKTGEYEIQVVCFNGPINKTDRHGHYVFYKNHQPFYVEKKFHQILERVKAFAPDFLHTHWLQMTPLLYKLSKKVHVPFTVRSHSFDTLVHEAGFNFRTFIRSWLKGYPIFKGFHPKYIARMLNSESCKGVLAFPFAVDTLKKCGIKPEKITSCFPVVAVEQFLNKSPNGNNVMNVGACLPKKAMDKFIDLASLTPSKVFSLYSIGYKTDEIAEYNKNKGNLVNIIDTLEPEQMPAEYKKHQWLVYTASPHFNSVGWPLAIAEAQASGVGVCVQNIRPDLKEYIGEAGYLFNSIEEVAEIIQNDVPKEMRELGFEQAKKSDIRAHIHKLTDLWVH